jgi:hypothetical protein
MTNGEHIGTCPECGHHRWWDNRGRKRAGQSKADAADYTCVECGERMWESEREAGRVKAPTARALRRAPTTTVLPTVERSDPIAGHGGYRRCTATTRAGERCKGGAMPGMDVCGPHAGVASAPQTAVKAATQPHGSVKQCQGVTKKGAPCRAAAQRGEDFCPAHLP